ncbi:MAG: putative phosphosugar-binding protein [Kangiellaceae bacterium]|jgi:uncharacterized phosphosugar-binding protein
MNLRLQHAYTTSKLAILNRELDEVLLSIPIDDTLLQKIIIKRANLVESLLNTLEEEQRRCFATHELKSNDLIIEAVENQRNEIKVELAKANKASKAIKKYNQV